MLKNVKIKYRLLGLWLASSAFVVGLAGLLFSLLLSDLHEEAARQQIAEATEVVRQRLTAEGFAVRRAADLLASRPDVIASAHIISAYQDPMDYRPVIFDVEKRRLAEDLAEVARAVGVDVVAVYDRSLLPAAFHAGADGRAGWAGFVSFTDGRPVVMALDDAEEGSIRDVPRSVAALAPQALPAEPRLRLDAGEGGVVLHAVAPLVHRLPNGAEELVGVVATGRMLGENFRRAIAERTKLDFAMMPAVGSEDAPVWRESGSHFIGRFPLTLPEAGSLLLSFSRDKDALATGIAAYRNASLAALLLMAAFLLPSGLYLLHRSISRPVELLLEGARSIESGQATRLSFSGTDELGELAHALNRMADTIGSRERELRESRERYKTLYESAPNAYLSAAAQDGAILQFNRALVRLLGYTRPQLSRMRFVDLFADTADGKARAEEVFEALRAGRRTGDMEMRMRRRDGSAVWVSVTVEPVCDDAGQVVESRSSIIDISERKQAEKERRVLTNRLQRALLQTIEAVAVTIEKRDPYTAGHQQRVAELAVAIAREMRLSEEQAQGLRLGALIHDIGKIFVPSEILVRPGRLSATEMKMIRMHPSVGWEIIRSIEFPWPIGEIVLQHHERLDGSGYPGGLRDNEIILEAKILAVADVVESMVSHRPYRPGLPVQAALDEIETKKGSLYDPAVVEACLRLFESGRFAWSADRWMPGGGPSGQPQPLQAAAQ